MIKYRKGLVNEKTERIIFELTIRFKEKYAVKVSHVSFDKKRVHILCKFLPNYSGGQVIKLAPETNKELWRGEYWTNDYYFATVNSRADKKVIEEYIGGHGRAEDIE